MCSCSGSLLLIVYTVFEFADVHLWGSHGGEVREVSLMWVGAQVWRRARTQGDFRRLPVPIRRKTQPTAEPPPLIFVGADNVADLEFWRLQYVCLSEEPELKPDEI